MRVRVLGPLRVWNGGGWAPVRAPQQRVVLAVLLVEAGRAVSTERLVEQVWGARPPRTAVHAIHVYITGLRRMFGTDSHQVLVTCDRGYMLELDGTDIDASLFERSVGEGRHALAAGDLDPALSALTEGLALWQAPAFADVPASPIVAAEAARLEQARLGAIEDRAGALIDLGRHADALDILRRLASEHPLRERFQALLMTALYRAGQRADALEAYQRSRDLLVEELGMEPGPQLRELHRAILADEVDEVAAAGPLQPHRDASRIVPAQLPPDVGGFTGRDAHLARLDSALPGNGSGQASPIVVITGPAGAGKSALAVHWAHRVRDRFPDGQLFVNLRGYAAGTPLRPIDALAGFLRALGVPPERVPADVDEAAALYRSMLAGKHMLVVLDNANHPDQVRPLHPASAGCLVLTTSRDHLRGLVARDGALSLTVDALTPGEARALLARLLGRGRADAASLAELGVLCGHLPLALRIAAANLAEYPDQTVAGYVAALSAGDRLAALEVKGDTHAGVRAAFDHSYAALPAGAARLFRRLGLVPGPDVTADSAAALGDLATAATARLLTKLRALHLIQEHAPGRYALHDLLRLYAAEQASNQDSESDRAAAMQRLCGFYIAHAEAAARLLYPQIVRAPSTVHIDQSFTDHEQAHAWLDRERANLVAVVRHAPDRFAWRLADAVRGYLYLNMHHADWDVVAHAGLDAATAAGAAEGQAASHLSVSLLDWTQDRYVQAISHGTQALALARACGWEQAEATALNNLAGMHWSRGQLAEAAGYVQQAVEIDMRTGDAATQATKLGNLGIICTALGQLARAEEHLTRSLAISRQAGSVGGEARALGALGEVHHARGQLEAAVSALERARELHQTIGDRVAEGITTTLLALVHCDLGRTRDAMDIAAQAIALGRDTGNLQVETYAMVASATVHSHLEGGGDAANRYRDAVALARELADPYILADALIGLAGCGDSGAGEEGLTLARRHGYRVLEGKALNALATIHAGRAEFEQAHALARLAVVIHTETGHGPGLALAESLTHQA